MEVENKNKGTVRCATWIKRQDNNTNHLVVVARGKLGLQSSPANLEFVAFDSLTASISSTPLVLLFTTMSIFRFNWIYSFRVFFVCLLNISVVLFDLILCLIELNLKCCF